MDNNQIQSQQQAQSQQNQQQQLHPLFKAAQQRYDEDNYRDSLELLDQYLEINKNDADGHALRGEVKKMLHSYKRAVKDFNRALQLRPDDAFILRARGVTKVCFYLVLSLCLCVITNCEKQKTLLICLFR
jgi:tetratricopeptide (TPR) repeat protein